MATASEASQQANRSGMDPKRLVVIFYLIAGIVLALFLEHVFGLLWARIGWNDRELFEGLGWRVSSLVGYLLALALVVGAYVNPKSHALSVDVATELMKVTWPSWSETRASTLAVVVASVVAAVLLFFIDTVAYNLMVEWLPAVWGKL
ncbi:preprotein translocase subunit SecE [Corallococcus sp. H22C18031201]|uniref:preprotein translocase subunit SecE n=1 Tax=Citreicoccus inhibens TaxID=2849499 RepID=UPI000E76026F|nr:preprotein translocase subunit SecE [Citreicoccus inhibens]MBU8899402.1 preprotein translocase subunit SecE [Citreicoccus inhibens]RJS17112.1 preprotein translocase subunit SecE [Corallococcus sp. H22C18031201]